MADEINKAWDSTNKSTDERLLIAGLTSFALRKEVQELLEDSGLVGDDFFRPAHGEVWDAARKLAGESRIITPELLKQNLDDKHHGLIDSLTGQPVRLVELTRGVEIVRSAAKLRRLIEALTRTAQIVRESESFDDVLASLHEQIAKLDTDDEVGSASVEESLGQLWEAIDTETTEETEPLTTGIRQLDEKLTGGGRRGQVMIIGGRPNDGKSILGLQIAGHAAVEGKQVAVFSAEMSQMEVMKRIVSSVGRVDYKQMVAESLDDHNRELAELATDQLKDKTLNVYDPPTISMAFVRQQCRIMKRSSGLDVVVIDYAQILQPEDRRLSREQQVAQISNDAKVLSRELDCFVLLLAQLNRGNTMDPDARPVLKDLRESDRLGQDSDIAVLLHHPKNDEGVIELCIAKNRNGARGLVRAANRFNVARMDGF